MRAGRTTIFTKAARAGSVKTRLCPPLTPEAACELAQAMLDDTLEKCRACDEFETALAVHPPEEVERLRALYPEIAHIEAQRGAELGERLAKHFTHALARVSGRTEVVIGSDAPHVPVELVCEAHERLRAGADLVLGPDAGGGYYLVGLARSVPELFTRVTMSTGDMLERTLALARELGLEAQRLAPQRDVDTPADARWLAHALAADDEREARGERRELARAPRTAACLARHAPLRLADGPAP